MAVTSQIVTVYQDSFTANLYTVNHFRMIGLIDVSIAFEEAVERVSLAFYSSSGTNNGKIKGLWYPIVGIKTISGPFVEFSDLINGILTKTTHHGSAAKGWLAKSLFFYGSTPANGLDGFSISHHRHSLWEIGTLLQSLYDSGSFILLSQLTPEALNSRLKSDAVYPGNQHSQKENFDQFIREIYSEASASQQ